MTWGWDLSVICGYDSLFYSKLMHEIDGYTIGFLDRIEKLHGSRVLDVGAGAGNICFKLANSGVREVVAIENTKAAVKKLVAKKERYEKFDNIIKIIQKDMYSGIIQELGKEEKFDIELFRRSLYSNEQKVREVLSQGFDVLNKEGVMFIVHPEACREKYFDNGFGKTDLRHALRWHFSNAMYVIKGIEYNRYTKESLENICKESCPGSNVRVHTPIRPAYNIVTIEKR